MSSRHPGDPEQPVQSGGGTKAGPPLLWAEWAALEAETAWCWRKDRQTERQSSRKEEGVANQVPTYTVNRVSAKAPKLLNGERKELSRKVPKQAGPQRREKNPRRNPNSHLAPQTKTIRDGPQSQR